MMLNMLPAWLSKSSPDLSLDPGPQSEKKQSRIVKI